jgi:thiamine pyrophosphokinase
VKLPSNLKYHQEWTLVGPLGPQVPDTLLSHPVLAVDGGANFSPRIDIWVGDNDSYQGNIKSDYIFKFPSEKSSSDLALALSLLKDLHRSTLHLWGFNGGRIDHELFNIGESLAFLTNRPGSSMTFYSSQGQPHLKLFASGNWKLQHRGTFSLGCLTPATVSLTGQCRYHLAKEVLLGPLSSQGLSNEAQGMIEFSNDAPIFMIFPELS